MTPIELTIHTDGGSKGNPGPAAIGIQVLDQNGQTVYEQTTGIGTATNNDAEYQAFVASVDWLLSSPLLPQVQRVTWKLDSMLVVQQLNRLWKIKEPRMREYAEDAWRKLAKLPIKSYQIIAIRRELNKRADWLVNQANFD